MFGLPFSIDITKVIAAAGIVFVLGYVWYLRSANASLEQRVVLLTGAVHEAEQIAKNNHEKTLELQRLNQKAVSELEASNKKIRLTERAVSLLRERINNAPKTDDGAVAPVLRDTLSQLRAWQRGEGDPPYRNRPPGNSEKPVRLRAAAAGS